MICDQIVTNAVLHTFDNPVIDVFFAAAILKAGPTVTTLNTHCDNYVTINSPLRAVTFQSQSGVLKRCVLHGPNMCINADYTT